MAVLVGSVALLMGRPDERPRGSHLTMDEVSRR
jgi:hypothetical protein